MDTLHTIGYISQFLIAFSLTPQVVKSWRTKSTKDISLAWNLVFVVGLLMFVIYSIGIKETPIIFGASIEAILAISLIIAKLFYK
jgi:MtN3 and saliva related transmembrane protein